jgi:hypothetical protein
MMMDKLWYKDWEPGDLCWLQADGWPDLPGTVVNRGKGEVFVKTAHDQYIAVSDPENIRRRDRDQELTYTGIKVVK